MQLTTGIDPSVNEVIEAVPNVSNMLSFQLGYLQPGLGNFGDRYWGTECKLSDHRRFESSGDDEDVHSDDDEAACDRPSDDVTTNGYAHRFEADVVSVESTDSAIQSGANSGADAAETKLPTNVVLS